MSISPRLRRLTPPCTAARVSTFFRTRTSQLFMVTIRILITVLINYMTNLHCSSFFTRGNFLNTPMQARIVCRHVLLKYGVFLFFFVLHHTLPVFFFSNGFLHHSHHFCYLMNTHMQPFFVLGFQ